MLKLILLYLKNHRPDNGVDVGFKDGGIEAHVVDGGPQVGGIHLPILGKVN